MMENIKICIRKVRAAMRMGYGRAARTINRTRVSGRPKIFVIGLNKTGTTTMAKALRDLGFILADEQEAKSLFPAWKRRDFKPIIEFCKSAEAFQDSPFSFPDTFAALDKAFPGSRFILTVRDDEHQWYRSITSFHSKLWGSGNALPPTKDQLKAAVNGYRGRPWDVNQALFHTPEEDPYNEEILKKFYLVYNKTVIDYFKDRPDALLVINVSKDEAYKEFVDFIGCESSAERFPWENKT